MRYRRYNNIMRIVYCTHVGLVQCYIDTVKKFLFINSFLSLKSLNGTLLSLQLHFPKHIRASETAGSTQQKHREEHSTIITPKERKLLLLLYYDMLYWQKTNLVNYRKKILVFPNTKRYCKSSNKLKCDKYIEWVERKREKCVVSHRRYSFLWVTLRNGYFPHTGREKDEMRGGSNNFVDSIIAKTVFGHFFSNLIQGASMRKYILRDGVYISTEFPSTLLQFPRQN